MTSERTRRRMTALVRRWERSTETRAAFARRHGLTPASFEYWKRRVRREVPAPEVVTFTPVHVLTDRPAPESGSIEVVLASGERLIVRDGVSPDRLRQIVSALTRPC